MRARGGHLNWHAKHANMVTGGHKEGKKVGKKEGKKRGQKGGHNMLYTKVTSTKSFPPGRHPTKNLRDQKTQDKTPKKSDVNSTTDNEWLRQTTLTRRSTFSQKLSLSKSSRAEGCRPPPKRMNFRKSSKRPWSPPLIFGKLCCKIFKVATLCINFMVK